MAHNLQGEGKSTLYDFLQFSQQSLWISNRNFTNIFSHPMCTWRCYKHKISFQLFKVKLSTLQWCRLATLACYKSSKLSRTNLRRSSKSNKAAQHCSYCEYWKCPALPINRQSVILKTLTALLQLCLSFSDLDCNQNFINFGDISSFQRWVSLIDF